MQGLKSKCEKLGSGVSKLEDKCDALSIDVDKLNIQLEKSLNNEHELQQKIADLSKSLSRQDGKLHDREDQVSKLEATLERLKMEKDSLHDQVEVSNAGLQDSKRRIVHLETELEQTETRLHRSESKANQLELSLKASQVSLENNGADNYLREELSKLRRDNERLQEQLKELNRRYSRMEADKKDLERKIKSPATSLSSSLSQIRAQIPLTSGGGRSPSQHAHNESLVKLRLVEQENERLLRKIRGLEQQLTDLEMLHGRRVQELLQDRRRERDKETSRQKDLYQKLESSQSSREKIFKERIANLERQVDSLKDQLSKEIRRRQTFISESSGISHEISELRHNLDQSLSTVAVQGHELDGRTLDREAVRLNASISQFGPDYTSRLTPSKSSTPKYRRTLHFTSN